MEERLSNESLENAISVHKTAVEACKELKDEDYCPALDKAVIAFLEELQHYRAIGTVDACKEAVEKQVPKRTYRGTKEQFALWHCPICKMPIFAGTEYCSDCGQKLKWSD